MINYEQIIKGVIGLTKENASFIKDSFNKIGSAEIEVKSENNFVTWVDKTSEQRLIKGLQEILPEASFIAEENTVPPENKEYTWIIDPLDGTTNFIHGVPMVCISIGLLHKNEIVAGVIHEINADEIFYAWKGGGAYLNDNPIHVSSAKKMKDSLLATGFPYYDYQMLEEYLEVFRYCLKNTHGLRRLGSAAADMAYVACGRYDGFFEYGLKAWDVAAGIIIVREAGGTTCDFKGGDNYLFGQEIVTANPHIISELSEVIKNCFHHV
jgi:myo-inositol-1(or 4)-monophosphatase